MLELIKPSEGEVPLSDSVIDDDLIIFTVVNDASQEVLTLRARRRDALSDLLNSIDHEGIVEPALYRRGKKLGLERPLATIGSLICAGDQLYLCGSNALSSQELSGITIKEIRNNRVFEVYKLDHVLTARAVLKQLKELEKPLKLAREGELIWKSLLNIEIRIPPIGTVEAQKIKAKLESHEKVSLVKTNLIDPLLLDAEETEETPYDLVLDRLVLPDQTCLLDLVIKSSTADVDLCLHLQAKGGSYFSANVKQSHTIRDLKRLVLMKKSYPISHQTLKFETIELQDSRSLRSYGLVDGADVDIALKSYAIEIENRSSREEFDVAVKASRTVQFIKESIHSHYNLRVEAQNLFLENGRELRNDSILSEIGLLEGTQLILTLEEGVEPKDEVFKTFVKTLESKVFTIETHGDISVRLYKTKISEIPEACSFDAMRLIFRGKELEEHRVLSDYGIQSESTIHLIQRV